MGITTFLVSPANDLLYGAAGLAGMLVFLAVNLILFACDRKTFLGSIS